MNVFRKIKAKAKEKAQRPRRSMKSLLRSLLTDPYITWRICSGRRV